MRLDYKYIEQAVAIDVTTTDAGEEYLSKWMEEPAEPSELVDLLGYIQDTYVKVPCEQDFVLEVATACNARQRVVLDALSRGFIKLRQCIWDDSSMRCAAHATVERLIEHQRSCGTDGETSEEFYMALRIGSMEVEKVVKKVGPFYDPWVVE